MTLIKKIIKKDINLNLMLVLENQNLKLLLHKAMFQIGMKKILWLTKLKILCCGYMLLMILTEKKLFERLTNKNYKKNNQKVFRVEEVRKRKGDKLYA